MMKIRAEKPFTSLADFIYRSSLGFTVLQNLCLGDAFACFGLNQRESLWEVLRYSLPYLIRPEAQGDLFRGHVWDDEASAACFARFSEYESVKKDYAVYGASVRGHPMEFIRRQMRQAIFQMDTAQIKFLPTEQKTSIAGVIIVRQRPQTAKGTVFATLEDEKGLLDLILHNQVLEKYKDVFLTESFVKVSGRLQKDGDSAHLLVHRIEPMFSTPSIGEVGISSRDFK